jgi:hypothetical protein
MPSVHRLSLSAVLKDAAFGEVGQSKGEIDRVVAFQLTALFRWRL